MYKYDVVPNNSDALEIALAAGWEVYGYSGYAQYCIVPAKAEIRKSMKPA